MDISSFMKDLKRNWIVSAIVTCVIGLVLLLFPSQTLNAICYAMGFLSVVMGVIRVVRYFKQDHTYPFLFQSDLVVGLFTVGFGLFMITEPETFASILPSLIGILLAGCGVGNILRAIDAKKAGLSQWGLLVGLAIVSIALGCLILADPFGNVTTITAVIGGCLIFQGVTDIITTLFVGKRIDDWKKSIPQNHEQN